MRQRRAGETRNKQKTVSELLVTSSCLLRLLRSICQPFRVLITLDLYQGGYSAEVPPLPIPNRVVKLSNADGTAYVGE